jgi:hypothetical protein
MGTIAGTGMSVRAGTELAVREAVVEARAKLGGRAPSYGLLFMGPDRDLGEATRLARALSGADIISSSSAGEITENGLLHDSVVVLLVASDEHTHLATFAKALSASPQDTAKTLFEGVAELRRSAATKNQRQLTTVLLLDALTGSGEALVQAASELAPAGTQIVGGAAADEGRFERTIVGAGEDAATDAAAALHVLGPSRWGIGVNHGLSPVSRRMRVTKAHANVVFEIDGAPAFEAYRRHAREHGVVLTKETASQYMIANELGVLFFDTIVRVRAPLSVGADGSLSCAAAIPEGTQLSILEGRPSGLIEAVRSAAQEARDALEGRRAACVVLFDCICRGMILDAQFPAEIEAVRSIFGDVPIAGFLTYGEIARYGGRLDGWHNATAVVVAIPA